MREESERRQAAKAGDKLYNRIRSKNLPGDPLPGLNEWDKGHINTIARRLGVDLINELEATAMIIKGFEPKFQYEWLRNPTSFSINTTGLGGNVRAIYMDDSDGLTECEDEEEQRYFSALHELGHQSLEHNKSGDAPSFTNETEATPIAIDNEIAAWEWAFSHANRWPSDETICHMMDSVGTYTDPQNTFRDGFKNNYSGVNPCDRVVKLMKASGEPEHRIKQAEEVARTFDVLEEMREAA